MRHPHVSLIKDVMRIYLILMQILETIISYLKVLTFITVMIGVMLTDIICNRDILTVVCIALRHRPLILITDIPCRHMALILPLLRLTITSNCHIIITLGHLTWIRQILLQWLKQSENGPTRVN